jgi:hypothetical protein
MIYLFVLLLPTLLFAQVSFGPTRLDDSLDASYFYPVMNLTQQNDLFCTWASSSDTRIATFGQYVGLDGQLGGPRVLYQAVAPGEGGVVCPAKLTVFRGLDGSETQLIFHS